MVRSGASAYRHRQQQDIGGKVFHEELPLHSRLVGTSACVRGKIPIHCMPSAVLRYQADANVISPGLTDRVQ